MSEDKNNDKKNIETAEFELSETNTNDTLVSETIKTEDLENTLQLSSTENVGSELEQTDLSITNTNTEMTDITIACSDEEEEYKHMSKDQDREQMIRVYFLFLIEIFKVAMASFLSMSVIQNCDGEVCSYSENLKRSSKYGEFVVGVNALNIICFAILYFYEFNREMFLIEYLDINKKQGDYHLPNVINDYPEIKAKLIRYNRLYYNSTKCLLLLTGINWITSGILVFKSFYSFKTITSYLTNILLIITKLSDSYSISKESFRHTYGLSAYIKEYTSFNVIDKDHE